MNRPSQDGPTLFKVGGRVLVSACGHELLHKFAPKWTGPYCIVCVPNRLQIVYQEGEQGLMTHMNQAKHYHLSGYASSTSSKRSSSEMPSKKPAVEGQSADLGTPQQ